MPYAAGSGRRLLGLMVALALIVGPLITAEPAVAAAGRGWSCLP